MYPETLDFQEITTDRSAVWVEWESLPNVHQYIVYRSDAPIPSDATEKFYAGEFSRNVQVVPVESQRRALLDETPPSPAWYLLQAALTSGDLVNVPFRLRIASDAVAAVPEGATRVRNEGSHPCHVNVYRTMPDLVFREDDAAVRTSMHHMARSLALRFQTGEAEDGTVED